jgi:hypothetical protein
MKYFPAFSASASLKHSTLNIQRPMPKASAAASVGSSMLNVER